MAGGDVMRSWWAVVMLLVSAIVVVGVNVTYTGHVQRQTERRFAVQQAKAEAERRATNRLWCELFIAIDPKQSPPTTDRAREVQQRIGRLRSNLGCE